MGQVAARLGWGDAFAYDRPAQIWREYAAMTALSARRGKALDLTDKAALDDAAYDALEPFQWGGAYPMGGRAMRLVAVKPAPAPAPDPAFPLRLNTGRYRDQWHTMTRTGYAPRWPSTGARRCWRCTPRMPRCMALPMARWRGWKRRGPRCFAFASPMGSGAATSSCRCTGPT
jgi:hypothetical protein